MTHTHRKTILAVTIFAFIALIVSTAFATTVVHYNWDQMVDKSDVVVTGTVIDKYSHWNAAKTKIYTTTTVAVSSILKGVTGETVEVRQLGGEVDGVGAKLLGTPEYTLGESVVLFLEPRPDGAFITVGLSQGKCHLIQKQGTDRFYVKRSVKPQGLSLVTKVKGKIIDPEIILFDELQMLIDQNLSK